MKPAIRRAADGGFTLIELLIVVALIAVVLGLAAPSFRDYILMQRLKGINAQIITDLAFARSEAVSRGVPVHVKVLQDAQSSCYIVYTYDPVAVSSGRGVRTCDCNVAEGTPRCASSDFRELKAVKVPRDLQVQVSPNNPIYTTNTCLMSTPSSTTSCSHMFFDPRNGGMTSTTLDGAPDGLQVFRVEAAIDSSRRLLDEVGVSGRARACVPTGSTVTGIAAC